MLQTLIMIFKDSLKSTSEKNIIVNEEEFERLTFDECELIIATMCLIYEMELEKIQEKKD